MKTVSNEMANINSQLNELRNMVTDERNNDKIDGLNAMKESIETLEMNMNQLMKEREQTKDQGSSELAAVRRWMSTTVKCGLVYWQWV